MQDELFCWRLISNLINQETAVNQSSPIGSAQQDLFNRLSVFWEHLILQAQQADPNKVVDRKRLG
jgi:hypothetical protein